MTVIIILILLLFLIIYVVADIFAKGANSFMDRWVNKTVWIWLPFYALWVLTRDLLSKMESKK